MCALPPSCIAAISLFLAASVAHLASCLLDAQLPRVITKCLLMPLLSAAMIAYARGKKGTKHSVSLAVCALLCGWAGDCFLLSTGDKAFLMGASCFLIGHVLWIMTRREVVEHSTCKERIVFALLAAICLAVVYCILGKPSSVIGAGVIVYGAMLMALVGVGIASVRQGTPCHVSYLTGGILFLISDGMIAIERFTSPFPLSAFLIMATYIAAQTLLASSVLY